MITGKRSMCVAVVAVSLTFRFIFFFYNFYLPHRSLAGLCCRVAAMVAGKAEISARYRNCVEEVWVIYLWCDYLAIVSFYLIYWLHNFINYKITQKKNYRRILVWQYKYEKKMIISRFNALWVRFAAFCLAILFSRHLMCKPAIQIAHLYYHHHHW